MTCQTYLWNRRKKSKRAHIAGTNGKSLCQIENSHTRLNGRGSYIPHGRKVCWNCKSLWAAGVKVARRNPHKPKRRPWRGLSSTATSRKTESLMPASEKIEPRLSVLLGEAVDDSPPWDDDNSGQQVTI